MWFDLGEEQIGLAGRGIEKIGMEHAQVDHGSGHLPVSEYLAEPRVLLAAKSLHHGDGFRGGLRIELHHHVIRSEEHTSELQSRFDLVCRLLLEKKKREY